MVPSATSPMLSSDVVIGDVAGRDQLDAGLVEAALDELLHELRRRAPDGTKTKSASGLASRDALQEGREIGIAQGHADHRR
jgi:hypothetical protein